MKYCNSVLFFKKDLSHSSMKFVLVDLFSDKRVIMYGVRLFSFALNAEPLGILSSNFIVLTYITVF